MFVEPCKLMCNLQMHKIAINKVFLRMSDESTNLKLIRLLIPKFIFFLWFIWKESTQ